MRPSSTLVLGREVGGGGGGPYPGKTLPTLQTDNSDLNTADGTNFIYSYAGHSDILHLDTSLSWPDFALDNMPSDFISMDTLYVNCKARKSASGDDRQTVGFKIKDGTNYTSPIANPLAKDSGGVDAADNGEVEGDSSSIDSWLETHNDLTASWVTTGAIEFPTLDTSASKATWDGAYVWIQQDYFKTKGGDGNIVQIDWIEFTGTYTGSTP